MKTVYDVQQLLKRFGIFIYVGDRIADLELMEIELNELYEQRFISTNDYQIAVLILRKEKRRIKEGDII
ncbi:MAG TPA: YqgQ family protein [Cerasibacillus sp.]|uniref:YqgQ family protein n=1 Tax=Cerasibacillus sp. TaxID=2498711 RepID=UPI002F3ECA2C